MNGIFLATAVTFFSVIPLAGYLVWRRRRGGRSLVGSVDESAALFDAAPVAMLQLDATGGILRANQALRVLLGLDKNTPNLLDLLHPEDLGCVKTVFQELLAGYGDSVVCESRLRHARSHHQWVQLHISLQRDASNQFPRFLAAAVDISERKRVEQLFCSEEAKLKSLVNQLPVAVWMLSPNRDLLFINSAYENFSGREKERVYSDPSALHELIHPEDLERVLQAKYSGENNGSYEVSYRILRDDGDIRYIREQGNAIHDERGNQQYQICSATDISGEMIVRDELHDLNSRLREANLRLRDSVRRDNLTGCINRSALLDEAEKSLQLEHRYRRSSALVFFDLNDFKAVNDNFGHHVGDRCLIAFAEQIKARLRTTDELGRYGGDEFVALLRETDAEQARQLLSTLAPIVIEDGRGSSIILRFSAGVACSNEVDVLTVDDWLRNADVQMYRQKQYHAPRGG